MKFIKELESVFNENSNAKNALAMSKYMKNNFPFFGIKTTERRSILKTLYKKNQREINAYSRQIVLKLLKKQQREFYYCAIEIIIKECKGKYRIDDIDLIKKLIDTKPWWDSVDTIAKNILGEYLKEFPESIPTIITSFSKSDRIWRNRSAILFQLGYKEKTNFELLKKICLEHQYSTEFFIQKAIGWACRDYA